MRALAQPVDGVECGFDALVLADLAEEADESPVGRQAVATVEAGAVLGRRIGAVVVPVRHHDRWCRGSWLEPLAKLPCGVCRVTDEEVCLARDQPEARQVDELPFVRQQIMNSPDPQQAEMPREGEVTIDASNPSKAGSAAWPPQPLGPVQMQRVELRRVCAEP